MKRSEFISSLGISASGLVLPQALLNRTAIKIYDNYLKALMHYDFSKVAGKMAVGDSLKLIREADNAYDAFAVAVFYNDYKLGYLPAYENIVIANMLDAKVALKSQVCAIILKKYEYQLDALAVEVYADLISPSTQLISALQNKRANDVEDIYRKGYGI